MHDVSQLNRQGSHRQKLHQTGVKKYRERWLGLTVSYDHEAIFIMVTEMETVYVDDNIELLVTDFQSKHISKKNHRLIIYQQHKVDILHFVTNITKANHGCF